MKVEELFEPREQITIESYLNKCGIEDVNKYFKSSYLEDYRHYDNIEIGSKYLLDWVTRIKGTIYILVDCDCDGILSSSLAYIYLKEFNNDIDIVPLFHNSKEHGLTDLAIMDYLRHREPSILWIPDAGSSNIEQCEELHNLGWEIIITDHHQVKDKEEISKYAILINNQSSDNVENKALCGTGVTWKLCCAMDKAYKVNYSNKLISYVHIANIADSMEFNSYENQTFRHWSIRNIHPNLIPFIEEFNEDMMLDNNSFSFGMISRINAVIRVGTQEQKKILFYALCGKNEYISKAIDICKKCKKSQDDDKKFLASTVDVIADKNVVLCKLYEPTTLTGLVANIKMNEYNKPIILVREKSNGECLGSCRSTVPLKDILSNNELFNFAEGHLQSFGISYQKENEAKIIEYFNRDLKLSEPKLSVLRKYTIKSLPKELFDEFEPYNELFGKGIERPTIQVEFIYEPSKMIWKNRYGVFLDYKINDFTFTWNYIGKPKREDLKQGYIDDTDRFIKCPIIDKKYTMTVIGTLKDNYTIECNKWWMEEYEASFDDIF